MTRVKTFGKSPDVILPASLNSIQDDYEKLYQNRISLLNGYFARVHLNWTNPAIEEVLLTEDGYGGSGYDIATGLAAGPNPTSLYFWVPAEYAGLGRSMTFRLRSTLYCAPGAAFNTQLSISLRATTGNWAGKWPIGATYPFYTTVPMAQFANATLTLQHPASASSGFTDTRTATCPAPAASAWYAVLLRYDGNTLGNEAHLWTDLSLLIGP